MTQLKTHITLPILGARDQNQIAQELVMGTGQGWAPRPTGNPPRGEGGVPRPDPPRKNDQIGGDIAGQNKGPKLNFLQ